MLDSVSCLCFNENCLAVEVYLFFRKGRNQYGTVGKEAD